MSSFTDLIDHVDAHTVHELAALEAPVVTFTVPTARAFPDAAQGRIHLKNLLGEARESLDSLDAHPDVDADAVLAQVARLVDDPRVWAHQAEGLLAYASPSGSRLLRVDREPAPEVLVGDQPHVAPLVAPVSGDDEAVLLALSQGEVRLFSLTRTALVPISLGVIPSSIDALERQNVREAQLQHLGKPRSGGSAGSGVGGAAGGPATASHHGHAGAGEVSDLQLDKFILEVAHGVRARLGADDRRPIILAAVAEHLPRLQGTGLLPALVDDVIAGNPQGRSAEELYAAARPIADQLLAARRAELLADLTARLGTGLASTDPTEVAEAAEHGRIATLFVDPGVLAGAPLAVRELVDCAIIAAVATGAELHEAQSLPGAAGCAAVMRY